MKTGKLKKRKIKLVIKGYDENCQKLPTEYLYAEGGIGRHLNGDPSDNRVDNLTWGTPSENMYDKGRHGTDHQRNKTHCPLGHTLQTPNLQERKLKEGWRCCKACHQARSDAFNGSELTYEQLADMRYFMICTGESFKFGTRRCLEKDTFKRASDWIRKEEK